MPLSIGEPAPWFTAPTPSNPEFVFDTAAGRYVLMVFLPKADPPATADATRILASRRWQVDDRMLSAFAVVRDPAMAASVQDMPGLRWFLDLDGAVSRLYGVLAADGAEAPMWLLLDPTLRVIGRVRLESAEMLFDHIARLKPPAEHADVPVHAPVLIAPRIFEPDLCERLIALHQADGGQFSGVMRDVGERTVAVMDELKKRRDLLVEDADAAGDPARSPPAAPFPADRARPWLRRDPHRALRRQLLRRRRPSGLPPPP